MFSNERSDFAIPVVGFMLTAVIALIMGLSYANLEWNLFNNNDQIVATIALGFILTLVSLFSLWKAFIVDGITFLLVGVVAIVFGFSLSGVSDIICIVMIVALLTVAFMSFRVGDYTLLVMDVLFAVTLLFTLSLLNINSVAVPAITAIALAAVSLYACVMDWMLVQDIASDYADEMLGDDDCCCDDDCDCGCHDEEE